MKRLLCFLIILFSSNLLLAQLAGTGPYQFSSFDNKGFDSINIGSLDMRFQIPIVSRTGRGKNFTYSLSYDNLSWLPPLSTAASQSWSPAGGLGFSGNLSGTTLLSYWTIANADPADPVCPNGALGTHYTNYTYHDPYGGTHVFNYTYIDCSPGGVTITGNGLATDGSGYYFDGTNVHAHDGSIIDAMYFPAVSLNGSFTDANGNSITNNGNNTITDTLGVKALSISGGVSTSSPITLTYPVTLQSNSATTASVSIYYKAYIVQTNFGCSKISEYPATATDLIDHITMPDSPSDTYTFSYEPTTGIAGSTTGRIASITLPTGGIISYKYAYGCNGTGINGDGTISGLTRLTTDGSKTYTRSYPNSPNLTSSTTTVTDEKSNYSLYYFDLVTFSPQNAYLYTAIPQAYETHRIIYSGVGLGATSILDQSTCYNGTLSNCDGGSIAAPPIASTNVIASYGGGTSSTVNSVYNSAGFLTASTVESGSTTLQKSALTYNNFGEVLTSTTSDASGNTITSSTYGYDETTGAGHATVQATSGIPQHTAPPAGTATGKLTSINVSTGAGTITTALAYYDTGAPVTVTDPDGGRITYGYDSTQTFATQTTLPTPSSGVALTTSAQSDQQSTSPLSSTSANGGQTKITAYDQLLRPMLISFPDGGSTSYSYSANQMGVQQEMTSSIHSDTETLYDGYGRVSRTEIANGQSSNPWYQVDYCYDATGLLQFQSLPYQGAGFSSAKQCTGSGTTFTYDALGRLTTAQNADGSATTAYLGRAIETTDVNGVQRITQYDPLGNIVATCEISSNSSMPGSGSPVSCGTDIAGTGFLTSYSYNLASHKTTVTQGSQTRTFTTDAAGRTTDVVEPERGETKYSYVYNSTGLLMTRTRPRANQTGSALSTTATQYDLLGRIVSITYNDGLTPNKQFDYDQVNSQMQWQESPTNLKGQLADTASGAGSSLTRDLFSYDPMGRVNNVWQCAPSICGTSSQASRSAITSSYDLAGNLNGESAVAAGAISYGLSPAGEVTSISNSSYTVAGSTPPPGSPAELVYNVVNGPNGPASYTLGNGLNAINAYDSLGRFWENWVCSNSTQQACTGGTQIYSSNSTWKGLHATSICDQSLGSCDKFGYDEFNRLTSRTVTSGTGSNFTYAYDRYGNRWNQTVTSGSGPSPSYSFNSTPSNNQIVGMSYDAAGNLLNDGFHTYTYDAEGNILSVDNGNTAQYVYDALNRRVRAQTASGTYEYLFDSLGQRTSRWIVSSNFGDEGRIFWKGQQVAYRAYNGQTFFEHQDILGTERARTNYQGQLASTLVSLPFGDGFADNVLLQYADQDNSFFAGLDKDLESSTDHAQYRQYSGTQGRWTVPDPYDGSYDPTNPQSLNRYTYGLSNPLIYTDRLGLFVVCTDNYQDSYIEVTEYDEDGGYFYETLEEVLTYAGQTCTNYPDPPPTQNTASVAPNSPQQPKAPQKPPCNPTTRVGAVVKALDGVTTGLAMANLAALHFALGGALIGATCLTPEPGEPVACAAGIFGGAALFGGGSALGYGAYKEATNEVIPAIKEAFCTP